MIDTQRKRRSAIAIGFMALAPSVFPDGSLDQGDRQAAGYGYQGILAGTGIVTAGFICSDEDSIAITHPYATASLSVPKATARITKPYATASLTCG